MSTDLNDPSSTPLEPPRDPRAGIARQQPTARDGRRRAFAGFGRPARPGRP